MIEISPVLTIDGPSGSGKGTVSKRIAEKLAWNYLDSGALYRALGVAVLKEKVDISDEKALVKLASDVVLEFKQSASGEWLVMLNGFEIQHELQTEAIGNIASQLAVYSNVRKALLDKQHSFNRPPGLVADGRDMGSVVFPTAQFKVFLTADSETRGKRRYKQLIEKGINANLRNVIDDIEQRDERDKNRSVSPLVIPEGALVIDSSNIGVEDVVHQVVNLIHNNH